MEASYRTREFLRELSEIRFADREYDYSLIKLLGHFILRTKDVIMYEWPELTFMKAREVDGCAYESVRMHPKTAGLLALINSTEYPRNSRAIPSYRKKLGNFRDMAKTALCEWA